MLTYLHHQINLFQQDAIYQEVQLLCTYAALDPSCMANKAWSKRAASIQNSAGYLLEKIRQFRDKLADEAVITACGNGELNAIAEQLDVMVGNLERASGQVFRTKLHDLQKAVEQNRVELSLLSSIPADPFNRAILATNPHYAASYNEARNAMLSVAKVELGLDFEEFTKAANTPKDLSSLQDLFNHVRVVYSAIRQEVLEEKNIFARVELIKNWIGIMQRCYEEKNYPAMVAIYKALEYLAILEGTMALVPRDLKAKVDEFGRKIRLQVADDIVRLPYLNIRDSAFASQGESTEDLLQEARLDEQEKQLSSLLGEAVASEKEPRSVARKAILHSAVLLETIHSTKQENAFRALTSAQIHKINFALENSTSGRLRQVLQMYSIHLGLDEATKVKQQYYRDNIENVALRSLLAETGTRLRAKGTVANLFRHFLSQDRTMLKIHELNNFLHRPEALHDLAGFKRHLRHLGINPNDLSSDSIQAVFEEAQARQAGTLSLDPRQALQEVIQTAAVLPSKKDFTKLSHSEMRRVRAFNLAAFKYIKCTQEGLGKGVGADEITPVICTDLEMLGLSRAEFAKLISFANNCVTDVFDDDEKANGSLWAGVTFAGAAMIVFDEQKNKTAAAKISGAQVASIDMDAEEKTPTKFRQACTYAREHPVKATAIAASGLAASKVALPFLAVHLIHVSTLAMLKMLGVGGVGAGAAAVGRKMAQKDKGDATADQATLDAACAIPPTKENQPSLSIDDAELQPISFCKGP